MQQIFRYFIYNNDICLYLKGIQMIQKALENFPSEVTQMILDLQESFQISANPETVLPLDSMLRALP